MTMTAAVMLAASGQTYAGVQTDKPFIGKQEITIKDGRLTQIGRASCRERVSSPV